MALRARLAWFAAIAVGIGHTACAPAAQPAQKPDAQPLPSSAPTAPQPVSQILAISFPSDETVVEVGRTHMLPFFAKRSPMTATTVPCSSSDDTVLSIARTGEVLENFDTGFVRVKANRVGRCELRIGGVVQAVNVVEARTPLWRDLGTPRVVSPLPGACVWGGVKIGVNWLENPSTPMKSLSLTVKAKSGESPRVLEPESITDLGRGPVRQAVFNLPPEQGAGDCTVYSTVVNADGSTLIGPETTIRIVKPAAEQVQTIAAADLKDAERPERFQRGKVSVGADKAAFDGKGGQVAIHNGADPPVCWSVEIPSRGMYQIMVVASGDWAIGAWPTVGLVIDGANQPVTSGQLVTGSWHRVAVGVPVTLEPGKRVISPRFENDQSVGNLGDRNLRLERIELVRVTELLGGAAGASSPAAGGDNSMMQMNGGDGMTAMQPAKNNPDAMTMMQGGGNTQAAGDPADPYLEQGADPMGTGWRPLRVAWRTMFDSATVAGAVDLEAQVFWDFGDRTPCPTTQLYINGMASQRQRSAAPKFRVRPDDLRNGWNELKLVCTGHTGITTESVVQRLHVDERWPRVPASSFPNRHFHRYTLHDPAWSKSLLDRVRLQGDARELRKASLPSGIDYELMLPMDVTGPFKATIDARGVTSKGLAKLNVTLRAAGKDLKQFTVPLRAGMSTLDIGDVELPGGPKSLIFRYDHKGYEESASEPGLYIESVMLDPIREGDGTPTVSIVHPRLDAGGRPMDWHRADAIVAQAGANSGIVSAEAVIDGVPSGVISQVNLAPGLICVQLPLRGVTPGGRDIALKITDGRGRTTISPAVRVNVRVDDPGQPTRYERAVRLANRFGLGADARSIATVLAKGEAAWLREQFDGPAIDPAIAAASTRFVLQRNEGDVAQRYMMERFTTATPARSALAGWVQNHFTTWVRKVETDRKWEEYQRLATLGSASFHDLLMASATSPAMMLYLDQHNSYKSRLNENYAREIMELHTLGAKAGYVQADVTAMARLITGWNATRQGESEARNDKDVRTYSWRFDPRLNDEKQQTVFGIRFDPAPAADRFDRALMAIEALARHPKTAEYISRQLVERFIMAPAPDDLVASVAKVFHTTGGDLGACVEAIAASSAFTADWTPRMSQPVDFAARLGRSVESRNPSGYTGFLRRCKQGVFDCPTPDGFEVDDASWTDSNAMIQRLRFGRDQAVSLVGTLPESTRGAKDLTPAMIQQAVDLLAIRLTGLPLSDRSNEAVMTLLTAMQGNTPEKLREAAGIVAQMPEMNLR